MGELGLALVLLAVYVIIEVVYDQLSTRERRERDPIPPTPKEDENE